MGSPKPLLPLGETTFLGHLLDRLRSSRARPLVVVLGHEAEAVGRQVPLDDVIVVVHPGYRAGMLSSVRAGLRALEPLSVDGFLLCPVDHPRVSPGLVDLLIARFEEAGAPVVIPVARGRRGHPALFARAVFGELLAAPDSIGARQVVWNHACDLVEVPTEEVAATEDIDTPERYRRIVEKT
jgi:molybdenum cofactor cytidylyltransferase